jgi:hypothetical protein
VPALHRSSSKYSKPLPAVLRPLLAPCVGELAQGLQVAAQNTPRLHLLDVKCPEITHAALRQSYFFPFVEASASFRSAGDADGGAELGAGRPVPAWTHVLVHGPADCGQAEVARAVLNAIDQVPVFGLDLPALLTSNHTSTVPPPIFDA